MSRSTPQRIIQVLLLLATVCFWLTPHGSLFARQSPDKPAASADTKKADAKKTDKKEASDKDEAPRPLEAWEKFVPDLANVELDGSEERAWEYRPYKVAVWFCLDGSPRVNAIYPQAAQEVADRSELLDASGWTLAIGQAPARYRSLFLNFINTPERCEGFAEQEVLNEYDKLMIVCLSDQASQIKAIVREFDVQTQQWGPINRQSIPFGRSAGQQLMNAIANSFMPLAQIERVTEVEYEVEVEVEVEVDVEVEVNGKKEIQKQKQKQMQKKMKKRDQVLMLLRAVRSCYTTELVEVTAAVEPESSENAQPEVVSAEANSGEGGTDGQSAADGSAQQPAEDVQEPAPLYKRFKLAVVAESNSPAFIKKSDLFLPVIRRTDRNGNLKGLEPLQFTFLTVDDQDKAEVRASIQSTGRNPLGQRKSKKAKKLALVIRPPQNSTTLKLLSREKQPIPMEGFTIKEVPVGAPRTVTGVPIGRSDYRGEYEVMPSDGGMRVLVISRGGRNLMKLPIVPGLYDTVEMALPNDEVRLYSQGVFKGFQTELLGLIIQREYVRSNLDTALKEKNLKQSTTYFEELKSLETLAKFDERLSSSVEELKTKTTDKREEKYINDRFQALKSLVSKKQAAENKIHYNEKTRKYGKSYQEQILQLKAAARENG